MILAIISWILFGLVAGFLAKFLMPGPDDGGFIMTTLLGIAGAVVGGFLANVFGFGVSEVGGTGFFVSLFLAVIGAILLLAIYRLANGRSLTT